MNFFFIPNSFPNASFYQKSCIRNGPRSGVQVIWLVNSLKGWYIDRGQVTLERLVEEGRRDEESATIRFNPGDKLIPVYAVINKKLRQKFFIDTGATMSIIPTSAVAELGIRIDNSTPVVGFQGVAGRDLAYQVRLESIEVEGQTVFDIRAIVYDLGMDEEAGLLGNDFLQYFQIDLDSIKGVLRLRKK